LGLGGGFLSAREGVLAMGLSAELQPDEEAARVVLAIAHGKL